MHTWSKPLVGVLWLCYILKTRGDFETAWWTSNNMAPSNFFIAAKLTKPILQQKMLYLRGMVSVPPASRNGRYRRYVPTSLGVTFSKHGSSCAQRPTSSDSQSFEKRIEWRTRRRMKGFGGPVGKSDRAVQNCWNACCMIKCDVHHANRVIKCVSV